MRPPRPLTKNVRVRVEDIKKLKEIAKEQNKQMPDVQAELIKFYRRNRKRK